MKMQPLCVRVFTFFVGVAILTCSGRVRADPPSRIARLSYTTGAIGFSPAGENDWVQGTINRPLTTGDRLWTEPGARAEIQVGGAMIRMDGGTGVSILNLDDSITQLQLTQGTLNVHVRGLDPGQVFEVDTPNLAFTLRQPGEYRMEVDPEGDATTIIVREGQGEVYGEGVAYTVDSRQPYRFTGTGLREYQYAGAPGPDDFDRWADDRDRRYDNSISARYVSRDVVGYQDLDDNGTWRVDATYGNVWIPNRVATGWAPYRDGHWVWIDPWGWTWVDDAPWGFAVSHYGRWTNLHGTWGWVPGPVRTRAYYAPALVVFVGGANFQLTISSGHVGGVAWFPLGPREVYRPSYQVSRRYFENVNRSNTVINNTVINNYYSNPNTTHDVYANRRVPGAVVAVPRTAFVQSQPVARAAVRPPPELSDRGRVAEAPPVAPTEKSVRGPAARRDQPPPRVFERPVVARTAPPAARVGFAAQKRQLSAKPGKPLDDAARKQLETRAPAAAPVVKLVAPPAAAPTNRPPPVAPGGKPGDVRGKSEERKAPAAPAMSNTPGTPAQAGARPQATPPGPAEQRAKPEPRKQPATPAAAPQVAPAAPTAPPREQRGRTEERGQAVTSPPGTAKPQGAPPRTTPPAPAEQRAKPEPRKQPAAPTPRPAQAAPSSPQSQSLPKVQPPGQAPKPAAGKAHDKKPSSDEQKREEEKRKQDESPITE